MKFNVGDKVKIISKKNGDEYTTYGFEIGNIYGITGIDKDRLTIFNGYCEGYIFKYNVKLVREFTKSDLKNGDIVTYRSGDKRTVVAGNLIDSSGYISKKLNQYTNELKDTVAGKNLDIIKVERPAKYETVFERKEEILDKTEKRYLANIIRPFKDRVKWISKRSLSSAEFILIGLDDESVSLPNFSEGTMYKGMEKGKEYTLKELGL